MSMPGNPEPPSTEPPRTDAPPKLAFAAGKPLQDILGYEKGRLLAVPTNVYGCAMTVGVLLEYTSTADWLATCGQTYFRLAFNNILQAMLVLALYQLDVWQHDTLKHAEQGDCYRLMGWFFFICHMLFFFVIAQEFVKSFDMIEILIWHIPTVEGTSSTLLFDDKDGPGSIVGGGMSKARKAVLLVFVILPKIAIASATLYVGGQFLSTSGSNTDLLLNALAATFILDVDEQIYELLAPDMIRALVEETPSFSAPRTTHVMFLEQMLKLVLPLILCAIFWVLSTSCPYDPCDWSYASNPCPVTTIFGY